MRLVVSRAETVPDLVRRVFDIKGQGQKARRDAAVTAVLDANPHLKDLETLPAGTLVAVPDIPDVAAPAAASVGDLVPDVQQLFQDVQKGLEALRPALDATIETQIAEVRQTAATLRTREWDGLAGQDAALKQQLAAMSDAAAARIDDLHAQRDVQRAALDEVEKSLQEFLSRFAK